MKNYDTSKKMTYKLHTETKKETVLKTVSVVQMAKRVTCKNAYFSMFLGFGEGQLKQQLKQQI